jgi:hypothetical protein
MATIRTGWAGTCSSVTLSSSNGWESNFDNIVVDRAAAPTPVPIRSVTFDDLQSPNRPLNGQYPSGLIDWGQGSWYLSGPVRKFTTNSVSYNGPGPTSRSFSFVGAHRLVSLDAYNDGNTSTTLTISCQGQPTVTATLAAGQTATISTGWSNSCNTVAIASSNGWITNFDNLKVQ